LAEFCENSVKLPGSDPLVALELLGTFFQLPRVALALASANLEVEEINPSLIYV